MRIRSLTVILLVVILAFFALISSCTLINPPVNTAESEETEEVEETKKPKAREASKSGEKENEVQTESPDYMLNPLIIGSYILYGMDGSDEYGEDDINIVIYDETSGTMYILAEYAEYDFTYTFIDEILTMNLDNGEVLVYKAMQTEVGDLWLTEVDYPEIRYYYYLDYVDEFTALGAWVKKDGMNLESISFWPEGRGYAVNWMGLEGNLLTVDWQYSYATLQLEVHGGEYYYEEFADEHRGDILELSTYDDKELVLYRVDGDLLHGYYFLQDSDAMDFDIKELALYEDKSALCFVNRDGKDTLLENGRWEINDTTGRLEIEFVGQDTMELDYFYTGYGLLLFDDSTGYSYLMSQGIDPNGN